MVDTAAVTQSAAKGRRVRAVQARDLRDEAETVRVGALRDRAGRQKRQGARARHEESSLEQHSKKTSRKYLCRYLGTPTPGKLNKGLKPG